MSYHYRHLNLHTYATENGQLAEAKVETNGYLLDLRGTANAEIMVVRGSVPISSMPLLTYDYFKDIKIGIWKNTGTVTDMLSIANGGIDNVYSPDEFCYKINRVLIDLCLRNGMVGTDAPKFSINSASAKFILTPGSSNFTTSWNICGDTRLYDMLLSGWQHLYVPGSRTRYRLSSDINGEQIYSTAANLYQFTEMVISTDAMIEGEINASTSSAFAMRVLTDYSLAGINPKVPVNIVPSVDRWVSFVPNAQPVTNMKIQVFLRDHNGEIHRLSMLESQSLTLKLCVRYVTKE